MRKILTILMICLSVGPAASAEGGHDGNGGGGVIQDGQYMTFYSAGLYVNPVPKGMDTLPSLDSLIKYVSATPNLTGATKTRLLLALVPSQSRTYYDVRADKFGADVQQRLKSEYQKATSASASQIVLYAVTDTNAKKTYLLPDFYKLNASGQMAILFHEAMWMIRPNSTYEQIIAAEVTFQAHLEQPNDFTSALRFVRLVGGSSDEARFTYEWDRRHGVITAAGHVTNGSSSMALSLPNLVGDFATLYNLSLKCDGGNSDTPSERLVSKAIDLTLVFPQSKFLEFFRDAAMNNKISFKIITPPIYENKGIWVEGRKDYDRGHRFYTEILSSNSNVLAVQAEEIFALNTPTLNVKYKVYDFYKEKWVTKKTTVSGILRFGQCQ